MSEPERTVLDPAIRALLDEYTPEPTGRPAWEAIVGWERRRARRARSAMVLAILAGVLGLALSPAGGAIVDGIADFSSWLRGSPGSPAPAEQQRAFDRANARSFTGFPPGTTLRELIRTQAGGVTYVLYGYRSEITLCLRLQVEGAVRETRTQCAPLDELRRATAPAVAFVTDEGFGLSRRTPAPGAANAPRASATFGVVADGASDVRLRSDTGVRPAVVASNSFLLVRVRPRVGERVDAGTVVDAAGRRRRFPISRAPFDTTLGPTSTAAARGPSQVDRHVDGGRIGWLERREARGTALPPRLQRQASHWAVPVFARLLQPEAGSPARVGFALYAKLPVPPAFRPPSDGPFFCVSLVLDGTAGEGCGPIGALFRLHPISVSLSGSGSSQFTNLSGYASDDVAAIDVHLATGDVIPVPLRDNAFFTPVGRAAFPIRVVSSDARGRIIDIQTYRSDGMSSTVPLRAQQPLRVRRRVVGPHGAVAVIRAGAVVEHQRCWHVTVTGGAGGGGCGRWPRRATGIQLMAPRARADTFVVAFVPTATAIVEIRIGSHRRPLRPVAGVVVQALTAAEADAEEVVAVARDAHGRKLASGRLRLAP